MKTFFLNNESAQILAIIELIFSSPHASCMTKRVLHLKKNTIFRLCVCVCVCACVCVYVISLVKLVTPYQLLIQCHFLLTFLEHFLLNFLEHSAIKMSVLGLI